MSSAYRFTWHRPPTPSAERAEGGAASLAPPGLGAAAGPDVGWLEISPKPPTPRDELLVLLQFAAEVEHALMVQYLYAAYSIQDEVDLKTTLIDIAMQEMAHFLSVQNLLLAVGGPEYIHIGRDRFRAPSQDNPLPFSLEPINSELLLERFVLVESPETLSDPQDARDVAQMMSDVQSKLGVVPRHVGALYRRIYWVMQPTDDPTPQFPLKVDEANGQHKGWHITPDDFADPKLVGPLQGTAEQFWGSFATDLIIMTVGDENTPRAELAAKALDIVFAITSQGEGELPGQNTHFELFLAAARAARPPGSLPAVLPVAQTPYLGAVPLEAAVSTPITRPYTRLWAELHDIRYTMLLLDIGMALTRPSGDADREQLRRWALLDMRNHLRATATALTMPVHTDHGPSGPTFGLLFDEVPADPRGQWMRYRGLLLLQQGLLDELQKAPELAADPNRPALARIISDAATKSAYIAAKF